MEDFTFDKVLARLLDQKRSRDPRARRLASVTNALVEVVAGQGSSTSSCSAAQIYAQGMTALEGTILRKTGDTAEVNESLGTQVALLEVLSAAIPYVEPVQIVVATLTVPSRVLRNMVTFCQSVDATALDTEDELGGVSAVLRSIAKTCGQIGIKLQGTKPDLKILQQLWTGTLLALISDPRPKVRKAASSAIMEVLVDDICLPAIQNTTAAFLTNSLKQARKQVQGDSAKDIGAIFHTAEFLKRAVIHMKNEKVLVDVMELLIALLQSETEAMTGANATTLTTDFVAITKQKKRSDGGTPLLVINALMGVIRAALEDSEHSSWLSQFASRVVASLLTAQPMWVFRSGTTDALIIRLGRTIWGQVLILGSRRILDDDGQLEVASKVLPLVVKMVLLLAKPADDNDEDEASVAFQLFVDLIQLFREYLPTLGSKGIVAPVRAITATLEQVLQPVYRPTWAVSLKAFIMCLQFTDDNSYAMDKVEMLILRRSDTAGSSAAKNAVDEALSTLVQAAGLDKVWSWIKWPSSESTARERGWLLGVLKSAGQAAQPVPIKLSFFEDEILGLARRFDKIAATGSTKHKLENRLSVIDTWKLLPCFFQQIPPDVSERLTSLSATMGKALEDERYPELTPVICHSITLLAKCGEDDIELHGDSFEVTATTLLPLLFKISMTMAQSSSSEPNDMETENEGDSQENSTGDKGQKVQLLGEAISSLCKISDKSFLQGLFKKLMHKLLEEMQQDSPSEAQLCAYLSLSQSMVKSAALYQDSIGFLFRASKPLLRDGQHGPRSLKRAYKLLAEICENYSSFFSDAKRLQELSGLLKETAGSLQVAARYMRLKCVSRVVEGLDTNSMTPLVLEELLSVTSEILLCLKDSNGKTRDAAFELLLAITAKCEYDTILRILSASLASETPHMRSASVMALSRVVYELVGEKEEIQASLPSLLKTVLCLIVEESREVIKSVVGFIRVCVTAIPKEQLEPLLPELVGSLMKYHKVKERFRSKIKIILKKLVKRFGYDGIMPHVPSSEARLLTHMRKVDERMKRRKSSQQTTDAATKSGFDDFLDSDEEDSDNGRTLVTTVAGDALTRASRMSKRTRGTAATKMSMELASKIQLPSEADGNIVDMLGSSVSKKVSFLEQEDADDSSDDDLIEFNDDGMLVVHETMENQGEDSNGGDINKKRRYGKFENENSARSNSSKSGKKSGDLGRAYKSKKAGGDVKRKEQKYEPYAFVPLNAKSYSKKRRKEAVESMSTVVRRGKKKT